jgi:hypothetical protein
MDESDIIRQKGLTLVLGGKKHENPPLTMGKAMNWREKMSPIISKLTSESGDIQNPDDVKAAFLSSPSDMMAIVESYVGWEHEKFMAEVTEPELINAFNAIMQVAVLPFLTQQAFKVTAFPSEVRENAWRQSAKSVN